MRKINNDEFIGILTRMKTKDIIINLNGAINTIIALTNFDYFISESKIIFIGRNNHEEIIIDIGEIARKMYHDITYQLIVELDNLTVTLEV